MQKNINGWELEIDDTLWDFIVSEYAKKNIAPDFQNIFRAFELTSFSDTKVVIFGQDPYPTQGVATGLAFSSNTTLPASLRNMFKELNTDLGVSRTDSNLEDWSKQGVLLLNTALTVEVGKPGSHSKIGWIELVKQVILKISAKKEPVVFVLLGKQAQNLKRYIDSKDIILEFVHPSPLSAYRGFFGSKMFSKINNELEKHGYEEIIFGSES